MSACFSARPGALGVGKLMPVSGTEPAGFSEVTGRAVPGAYSLPWSSEGRFPLPSPDELFPRFWFWFVFSGSRARFPLLVVADEVRVDLSSRKESMSALRQ